MKSNFSEKFLKILSDFRKNYIEQAGGHAELMDTFERLVKEQFIKRFTFEPYHQKIRAPFDYYRFGLNFFRPLVDFPHSTITGIESLENIDQALKRGENVILLANHQSEADPQLISLLLEKNYPHIGEKLIYVAGERVVTDVLAIPLSMGCDLLCIYSKRYIDHPPDLKGQKQLHNKNTMQLMSRLLQEGGKIIYVAPSGGRDRKNLKGVVEVAPFDPQSLEMFYLMARKAKKTTHFYPLTLSTYHILPPPDGIQKELGEARTCKKGPIHLVFSEEFDMEKFPGYTQEDKTARREARAHAIWQIVKQTYERIPCL